MIIYGVTAELVHQPVEEEGTVALEKAVRVSIRTYTIYNIGTIHICGNHIIHCLNIILTVTVNAYGNISMLFGFHKTGKECGLMAEIA